MFPASVNYVMIVVVVGAVKKRKRWTNVSLNHCETCTLLRMFNQAFTWKGLTSVMNIYFELEIGALLSET
jgi:hypothetical protein